MDTGIKFTRHARDRCTARGIPPEVTEVILDFGASRDAGDGARKHALSKESLREIKRVYGPRFSKAMHKYRTAYVVAAADRIVTVAFARQPIFH